MARARYNELRFIPGCKCCPKCWSFIDDFNDMPPGSNVGSDWIQIEGVWGIYPLFLFEKVAETRSGTANAKIIGATPVPERSAPAMSVTVEVIDPQIDDVFYIYLGMNDPNDTTPHAKFTYLDVDLWEVELSTGEKETQQSSIYDPAKGVNYLLSACIESHKFEFPDDTGNPRVDDEGNVECAFKAGVPSFDKYPWNSSVNFSASGRYYGLGHNNTDNGAIFDDFSVLEFRSPNAHPDSVYPDMCYACFCRCDDGYILGKNLNLHVDGYDRLSCFNPSISIKWNMEVGSAAWSGIYNYTRGPWEHAFRWRLVCEDDTDPIYRENHFVLTQDYPQSCCAVMGGPGCPPMTPDLDLSSCDPFVLVFGPYLTTLTNLTCGLCYDPLVEPSGGYYYVTITE